MIPIRSGNGKDARRSSLGREEPVVKEQYQKQTILGQPSFVMKSDCVELAVTELGGNMAPVTFCTDTEQPQMPYFFNPWQMEGLPPDHSYMDVFRGDFLCLPFGKMSQDAPMHGESCGRVWQMQSCTREGAAHTMTLHMTMQSPSADLTKILRLNDGQNAVYIRHEIQGLEGYHSFSHHATLHISPEHQGVISHSPIHFARTIGPRTPYDPRESSYMFVLGGETVEDLTHVPTMFKDPAYVDCSVVPCMIPFSGAAQLYSKAEATPAWTCVWFPNQNFVWFALKDAKKQPVSHFWMEFGGRYQYPWNGRTMAIALEDMGLRFSPEMYNRMRSHFADMEAAGIKVVDAFDPRVPFHLNYIEGMAQVCPDFGKVKTMEFAEQGVTLVSESGKRQFAPLDWQFCFKE